MPERKFQKGSVFSVMKKLMLRKRRLCTKSLLPFISVSKYISSYNTLNASCIELSQRDHDDHDNTGDDDDDDNDI